MSFLIDPFRLEPPPDQVSYVDIANGSFAATFTKTVQIGTAARDREVFLAICKSASPTYRSLVSATIGGVTAKVHGTTEDGTVSLDVIWISAPVPTGTTASVVLTFSGSGTGVVYIASFAAYKLLSSDAFDVAIGKQTGSDADDIQNMYVGVKRRGILLFAVKAQAASGLTHFNVTGVNKDFETTIVSGTVNQVFLGGCATIDADDPSYELTVASPDPSLQHFDAYVAASFR